MAWHMTGMESRRDDPGCMCSELEDFFVCHHVLDANHSILVGMIETDAIV